MIRQTFEGGGPQADFFEKIKSLYIWPRGMCTIFNVTIVFRLVRELDTDRQIYEQIN